MKNKNLFILILILGLQSAWIYFSINSIPKIEVIQKKETTILSETDFIKSFLKDIQNSVLHVTDLNTKEEGSALILTSDGLVLTLNSNILKNNDYDFKLKGKSKVYEVKKRDPKKDLALVQIGEFNLKPCSFAQEDIPITLGEKVYILAEESNGEFVFGEGVLKSETGKTNILADSIFNGAPVFNKSGSIIGIAKNNHNLVDIILINSIKEFIDL